MAFAKRTVLASVAGMFLTSMAAAGDVEPYRLSPGDTVEIGIAPIPDRTQRAVVQMDGNIALPEVGMVMVGGLTASELQNRMQTLLPATIFHVRLPDGREQMVVVKPGDITAIIADYRPIYVTGDVLTPGQQVYRPLMTVRQALAVSGGFSLLRSRAGQTGPDPVDLRRDYETLWGDYTKEYFHAARLRAELQDQADFDKQTPQGSPLSPSVGSAVAQAEADALKIALSDFQQEQAFLEKGQKDAADQIELLQKREQVESESVKADQDDLAKVTKAFDAGNLTNTRLADVRRALLLSSSGALQTSVELMRARRQQEDYVRQRERNDNQRKVGLLTDLKDTNARLGDVTARLRAASEKLQPTGASAQPLPIAGETIQAQVTIVRKIGDEWRKISADEDTIVMPGDTVEAKFSSDLQSAAIQ
ncbi:MULTISPECIES: polysaccharide biosynthesis/export family protein [unclassified Mesorhizobium]|uniref:polysaccharide biosynthesis/export family protein n=1 Tax=unclassified Mesorhizobium TaxID=325217 RepID=UPI00112DFF13|nr:MULTISPECIES: polysaccharide biosynthesis/export family protein [unclassified Mesorhizobium]TPM93527.1 sugar ABC transporter substrate-binding protein [Mesorhizobium sp. B2-1-3A]BCG90356.1 sugar ABC transporter substrate-binding protein [Mesorhizobium sp. 113-3-9]